MKKYSDLWNGNVKPPSIGQEIETDIDECYLRGQKCIDVYQFEDEVLARLDRLDIDFAVTVDSSGPLEVRLPPIELHRYSTLREMLHDLRNVLNSDYPYPFGDYEEQLGCHVHVRPFPVPRHEDDVLKYRWAKFAIIALNLLPLLKPLVCWFKTGSKVRCRNSFDRWATLTVDIGRIPIKKMWSNRNSIEIAWSRVYSAVTASCHRTIEIRAFETVTVNAYAFVWVAYALTNHVKLLHGRRILNDYYMMNYTSIDDPTPSKLVIVYRNEKVVVDRWSPKQFYEWLRGTSMWKSLPAEARAVIEYNFERVKISTFDDAVNAGLL